LERPQPLCLQFACCICTQAGILEKRG
jgi:hypothetical protein